MAESKRVIVCADDYAMNQHTVAGILRLLAQSRLSAVSCFSDSPSWPQAGSKLEPYLDRVAVGLHFNLTEPFGHGERPLGAWIAAAVAGRIDAAAVRGHLQRQIERFTTVVGRLPCFIDGHQHVHAFPQIRSVVRAAVAELDGDGPVPVRDVSSFFGPTDAPFKRYVIRSLARLRRSRVEPPAKCLNSAMSGDYSLSAAADYPELFARWLAAAPDLGLIMCHPAADEGGGEKAEPMGVGARELAFLGSAAYGELLQRCNIRLAGREVIGTHRD